MKRGRIESADNNKSSSLRTDSDDSVGKSAVEDTEGGYEEEDEEDEELAQDFGEQLHHNQQRAFHGKLSIKDQHNLKWKVVDVTLDAQTKSLITKNGEIKLDLSRPFTVSMTRGLWPGFLVCILNQEGQIEEEAVFHCESHKQLDLWLKRLEFVREVHQT